MPALEKADFFEAHSRIGMALTYDDVEVVPGERDFDLAQVNLASKFSTGVDLKLPIVSAAMDTVTESDMAIAVAKLGGIGVIHAGLSIDDQRFEVRRVKKHLGARIDTPRTVTEGQTLERVLDICDENKWDFRTFPVVDKDNRLRGVLTQSDFRFSPTLNRRVGKVMTPLSEVVSMPADTTPEAAYRVMIDRKKTTIPLLNDDGTLDGLFIFSDVEREVTDGHHSTYNTDSEGRLLVAAAVPTDEEALKRIEKMGKYLDVAVLDTAQGDTKYAFDTLRSIKASFPDLQVVVGNITNPDSARKLAKAGADGIKVGQGPGSICTTRIETGIGMPQITAVYDCSRAVREFGVPVCADGGITKRGDVLAAIVAGADSVMMGSMLAGTDEVPTEIITSPDGKRVVPYRGMGSAEAMKESVSSRKRYSVQGLAKPLAEGVSANVSYKGSVIGVLEQMRQALVRGMGYSGLIDIETAHLKGRFIRQTGAGLRESHPHDVDVTSR